MSETTLKSTKRDFLKVLGLGSVAAAAPLAATASVEKSENNDEKRKARYRETDHVKKYYQTNKY